jgi:hypothetical protein
MTKDELTQGYLKCLLDFVYYGEQRGKPFMRYRCYGYSEDTKLIVLLHTLGGKVYKGKSKGQEYFEWRLSGKELDNKISYIMKLKQYAFVAKNTYNLWLVRHFTVDNVPINDDVIKCIKSESQEEQPKKKKYSMFS